MEIDINYCSSSFLMLRMIYDHRKTFAANIKPCYFEENADRFPVKNSFELEEKLKLEVEKCCKAKKAALCLSGGIDSAILAQFMPKGSIAYTFKCIVPGIEVIDETTQASRYARECGLVHKVIEIYWEDFEKYAPILMMHKGAPIHSIEVQIYKCCLQAQKDGVECLIFGESADVNYGGQNGLLSRDYTTDEYIERYSYLMPTKVLRNPIIIRDPFEKYSENGKMNVHEFNRHTYYVESMGSYDNSTRCAGMGLCAPFSKTYMSIPLDIQRVRQGENKYLVREVFGRLYPTYSIPPKTPMPRPMNEWMKDWEGPEHKQFLENIPMESFTGDQKWLMYILEKFLIQMEIE